MSRRVLLILFGLSVLASVVVVGPRTLGPSAHAAEPSPLKVMPLGDSITWGMGTGGYRSDLWQRFKADGRPVDFVGSQSDGPALLGDKDHEGHGGWRIDQISAQVQGWLTTSRPDVVLLMIGTNDVIQNFDLAHAPARLSALIDKITATVPNANVFVSTITPLADPAQEARGKAFNATIPGIVAAKQAQGRHVHLVDQHGVMTAAELTDGIHPTNGGYSKMARRWYGTLNGLLIHRYEAESVANTRSDARVLTTANASGNAKVGYIDHADSYLQFAVSVKTAGTYRLWVRAGNGTSQTCGHQLSVNGKALGELRYPSYGWDQWVIVATNVQLNAGSNSIRLAHATCFAEIDSIDLALTAAASSSPAAGTDWKTTTTAPTTTEAASPSTTMAPTTTTTAHGGALPFTGAGHTTLMLLAAAALLLSGSVLAWRSRHPRRRSAS